MTLRIGIVLSLVAVGAGAQVSDTAPSDLYRSDSAAYLPAPTSAERARLAGDDALPEPEKWKARRDRRDDLRAPVSVGIARLRRDRLGLGRLIVAAKAVRGRPEASWVTALKALGVPPPSLPLAWPIDGGRFGRGVAASEDGRSSHHRHARGHRGVDITAPLGTPVRAVAAGLVLYAGNEVPGYGNLLVLQHGGGEVSAYAHLSAIAVAAGEIVGRGQQVALVGTTGISRGPHLHFEWREGGRIVDPMRRMDAAHVPRWLAEYHAARPLRRRPKRVQRR
ncbi:MAG: M23 family metallopeptidase [Myxococcota bacterium]